MEHPARTCERVPRAAASEPRGPQARGPHQGRGRPAVSSARPACHAGDAAGLIVLIDTFLPAAHAPRAARLLPPSSPPREESTALPPAGDGGDAMQGTRLALQKITAFNEGASREMHQTLEK